MPQLNDYQVDTVLTNLSVGYENLELIGEKLFPRLKVNNRYGIYWIFDKAKFRVEDDRRTGVSRAQRVSFGLTRATYGPLLEHSLEEAVEYEVRDTYPTPHDARADATEDVSSRLALGHEKAVADILTSTSVLTQNTTLSGTSQLDDYANSDPFGVIQTGIDTILTNGLVTANTIAMGYQVWSKLKFHPDLLGRLSVASVRVLTEDLFASLVGVENILIGKALRNTAAEGQTDSLSFIWGKDLIIAYVTPTPGIKRVSLGYTLYLNNGRVVDRWDEPWNKAEFVRATDYYEAKLVSLQAAYLVKAAVS